MNKHFIKNIEIKNFKCFQDFKAEGFSRVNLIGGKNNVGKTAFMEAVYVNVESINIKGLIASLKGIKFRRENLNILSQTITNDTKVFLEQSNNFYTRSNINEVLFKIKDENGIRQYIFDINNQHVEVNINDFSFDTQHIENIEFIDNFGMGNNEIIRNYSFIQKRDEEDYLNSLLNKFDSQIESFKIIAEKPQCKVNNQYLEITELGDGARHLVSIITSLYKAENGYLFIDEMDNGIHYTMLDELWDSILIVSKKLNVQVFATTHSKECIESYARVAKKLEDKEITYTILTKLKDDSIDAGVYDASMLINTIDQDHEVRGW